MAITTARSYPLILALALVFTLTSGSALGAIYKWKDATGRVQLSDQPPKDVDAEILHVAPSTMQGAQPAPGGDQSGSEGAGSAAAAVGADGQPRQEGPRSGGASAGASSASATAASQSQGKTPEEIARENRKIRQARRDRCNDTLTKLLTRGNRSRPTAPSDDLRKELRENCK
jgi:hypothetical protein